MALNSSEPKCEFLEKLLDLLVVDLVGVLVAFVTEGHLVEGSGLVSRVERTFPWDTVGLHDELWRLDQQPGAGGVAGNPCNPLRWNKGALLERTYCNVFNV